MYVLCKQIIAGLAALAVATGCCLIDEDTSDCGATVEINYILRQSSDVHTQLQTELGKQISAAAIVALQDYLDPVFAPVAQEANLGFYKHDALDHRAHKDKIGATAFSYSTEFEEGEYLNLAVANIAGNGVSTLVTGERPQACILALPAAETVESQKTGLFSARKTFEVENSVNRTLDVTLDMVNSAVLLVADTTGSSATDLKLFTRDMASSFNVCDSTFHFDSDVKVRAENITLTPGWVALSTVNFPSRDALTKADNALWEVNAYAKCADGTVTETVLGFVVPLKAGTLKIIKAKLLPDGTVVPDDSSVGVSVTLDWNTGYSGEIEL